MLNRSSRLDSTPDAKPSRPADRVHAYGIGRLAQGYGITVLAALLGLPGLAAGLISTNDCQLQGFDCADRLAYGVISGVVLALAIQLLLSLHFGLGWLFWSSSALIMAAAATHLPAWPVTVAVVVLAPAAAAWISQPPLRRFGVGRHRLTRLAALLVAVAALALSSTLL